jgi:sporulation protein YlmC with PRC-barrel domain
MKTLSAAAIIFLGVTGLAAAQTAAIMSAPPAGKTVTKYYKQSVYDPAKDKIGTVDDVILDDNGRAIALIIGVGGFLGAGEKDIAVAFNTVTAELKNGAWYLTLDTTKDALKAAWVPANS